MTNELSMTSFPAPATARPGRRLLTRAGAVLAGLVTIFVVSTATDAALHACGVFPPLGERMADGLFLLAMTYRLAYGVLGSYVTARLAPDRPTSHALVLGAIGVALSVAGAVAMWDAGPAWYSLAVIASAMPCAWLGGRVRERKLRAQ